MNECNGEGILSTSHVSSSVFWFLMKSYRDKQLFNWFHEELSSKTGDSGPPVYQLSVFSLWLYAVSVLGAFSRSVHLDRKCLVRCPGSSSAQQLPQQKPTRSWSVHIPQRQHIWPLQLPEGATPGTSQKGKNSESHNQLGSHKQCKRTETHTSPDLCSFCCWLLPALLTGVAAAPALLKIWAWTQWGCGAYCTCDSCWGKPYQLLNCSTLSVLLGFSFLSFFNTPKENSQEFF